MIPRGQHRWGAYTLCIHCPQPLPPSPPPPFTSQFTRKSPVPPMYTQGPPFPMEIPFCPLMAITQSFQGAVGGRGGPLLGPHNHCNHLHATQLFKTDHFTRPDYPERANFCRRRMFMLPRCILLPRLLLPNVRQAMCDVGNDRANHSPHIPSLTPGHHTILAQRCLRGSVCPART